MEQNHDTELFIPCAIGRLEARLLYSSAQSSCGIILCPPHPLLAGNIDNNVVQTLAQTLCPFFPVLLFNYRAVGKSSTPEPDLPLFEFWDRLDQRNDFSEIIDDTARLLSWSKKLFSSHHLIGYSFGAFIGQHVAQEGQTLSLTAITPPLHDHDFSPLKQTPLPVNVILAADDDLTPTDELADTLSKTVITLPDTDHFFRSREQELAETVYKTLC